LQRFFSDLEDRPLYVIAQTDLNTAIEKQKRAIQSARSLRISFFWEQALTKCVEELENAKKLATEVSLAANSNNWEISAVFSDPKWRSYVNGAKEIYKVAVRIVSAGQHFRAPLPPGLAAKLAFTWSAFTDIIKEENTVVDYTYSWDETEPNSGECGLCRVPYTANGEKTILWDNTTYHTSCANFWVNRVMPTPIPQE